MTPNFAFNPATNYSSWNNQQSSKVVVVDMSIISHTNQELYEDYKKYLDHIQNQLNDFSLKFQTTNLLLVWEYTKSYYRINLNPNYKAGRKKKHDNFRLFAQWLYHDIGTQYHSIAITGVESDDIIAELSTLSTDKFEVIIISTDRDLLQLLDQPNVKIFDAPRNQLFTEETLCDFKIMGWRGFNPSDVLPYKLIAGDKSDNIPACANRVGTKTAIELYLRYGDPRNWAEWIFNSDTVKNKAEIMDFINNKLDLHIKLMKLPNSQVLNYQQKCYINDTLTKCMNTHIKQLEVIRKIDVDVTEYQQTGNVEQKEFVVSPTEGVALDIYCYYCYGSTDEEYYRDLITGLSKFDIKHLKEYPQLRKSKSTDIQVDFN